MGFNVVIFMSNILLAATITIWWWAVVNNISVFDLSLRHNVYANIAPKANFLALANDGAGMRGVWQDIYALTRLVETLDM